LVINYDETSGKKNQKSMGWSLLKFVWQRDAAAAHYILCSLFMPVVPAVLTDEE